MLSSAHARHQVLQLPHLCALQLQLGQQRLVLHARLLQPRLHDLDLRVKLRGLTALRLPSALQLKAHRGRGSELLRQAARLLGPLARVGLGACQLPAQRVHLPLVRLQVQQVLVPLRLCRLQRRLQVSVLLLKRRHLRLSHACIPLQLRHGAAQPARLSTQLLVHIEYILALLVLGTQQLLQVRRARGRGAELPARLVALLGRLHQLAVHHLLLAGDAAQVVHHRPQLFVLHAEVVLHRA
mmetsp:Transcript_11857/g.30397  ORF Transcript_11857/g.30397 Transcript_11857/m.30397 type:complete len:240 (+) Transcript_11857:1138-1857(+)